MNIDENEFFRQATLRISSSLTIETAMRRCMDYLNGYLPVSGMIFVLYDPELNLGRILAAIWPPHFKKPGEVTSLPKEYWRHLKEEWAKASSVRIFNDIELEAPHIRQTMSIVFPIDMSHIHMDLELEKRRLGSLDIFTEGKNRYTRLHAHLISLLHEPFAISISNILQHQEILRLKDMLADDNRYLHQQMHQLMGDTIIGADFGLRGVMEMVRQVATLDSPVLLMGETGAGKEVIANAIHLASPRKNNPFITVNCGAIPENLIDSELFGHEKGAFTGAISRKRGRFERAHGGTIFLDEIGELPPAAQVRMLRVVQQHEIERVGGTGSIPVDVRIISATHQNLPEMVSRGTFREDLWFRLNVFPIMIPPLRQRVEDIPALVNHFIEKKSRELKISERPLLAQDALEQLQGYHWPGNVRELENLVERALILNQITQGDGRLRFDPLSAAPTSQKKAFAEKGDTSICPLEEMIASHITKALARTGGKVEGEKGAARLLGLHPSTLRGRMKKLGIPYGRKTKPR
ncbi:MAG: sigma-54 dependent transcriptional regulator [Thermodesulfobacteriota bacterium]